MPELSQLYSNKFVGPVKLSDPSGAAGHDVEFYGEVKIV
jgi:hypothetical protein